MTGTTVRPTGQRSRRGRRSAVGWFFAGLGMVLVLSLMVGGFYTWRIWSSASEVPRSEVLLPTDTAEAENPRGHAQASTAELISSPRDRS